jgi:(2Fe-2S) ferredoxin
MSDLYFQHHVFCCANQRPEGSARGCCASKGAVELHAYFKQQLQQLGLSQTIRVNKAGCLDRCEHGPTVVIYPDGVWYRIQSQADIDTIVAEHLLAGRVVTALRLPDRSTPPSPAA